MTDAAGDLRVGFAPDVGAASGASEFHLAVYRLVCSSYDGRLPMQFEAGGFEVCVSFGKGPIWDDVMGDAFAGCPAADGSGAAGHEAELLHFRGPLFVVVALGGRGSVELLPAVRHFVDEGR